MADPNHNRDFLVGGFAKYQELAAKTASKDVSLGILALGLAGESGEVCDIIKKVLGHGHPLELHKVKLIKELGDVLWYLAVIAHVLDVPLEDIAQINIAKLAERYPDGFDSEKSLARYQAASTKTE